MAEVEMDLKTTEDSSDRYSDDDDSSPNPKLNHRIQKKLLA